MPKYLFTQPDGNFAAYSTVVNCIIDHDMTRFKAIQEGYDPKLADKEMTWQNALNEMRDTAWYEHDKDLMKLVEQFEERWKKKGGRKMKL